MATARGNLIDVLSSLALFSDLPAAELESVSHIVDERRFADGERILRQGVSGSGFYIILAGEAIIRVDGQDYGKLGRGDFFGEISALLGDPPVADIVAGRELYCAIIPGPALEQFMVGHPKVMFRMLQSEARKLRTATRWRS
ncbi:MAG TPA: cyclic nucleotide-binding domain-containing protein [Candidatus Limnocylindria bacterium]|jgi:CRP-like cAMP-binding protein|nr:cyclic nucleotide-binding domain-containing protein [Candidatus Limnocylindria bacterium]